MELFDKTHIFPIKEKKPKNTYNTIMRRNVHIERDIQK